MQNLEGNLGEMSLKCNARLLEKKGVNMRSWENKSKVAGNISGCYGRLQLAYCSVSARDRHALASQLAVLRSCPGVISRLSKDTASLLLAAKVLVISRLLHTKISQRSNLPPYLESLRTRLATLRRRLLTKIDRTMMKPELSGETLVEAMSAFALATSSSPTDVLRHYHHVRLEAIIESGRKTGANWDTQESLKIYINTLRDTRAAIPVDLVRALGRLKSVPILQSSDLYSVMDLNLDLHEQNLGDDIRTFTPYVRLDDLQKAEAEKLLKQWGSQAFSSFLNNLRQNVSDIHDTCQVTDLRSKTLDLWLSNQQYVVGIDSSEVIDSFRDVFNSQWFCVINQQVSSLNEITSLVQATLREWRSSVSDVGSILWSPAMLSLETSNGAKAMRETLTATLQGRNELVRRVAERYADWIKKIEDIEDTVQRISHMKWDDGIDAIDADDDILNNRQVLLSEDDPRMLQEKLSKSLRTQFSQMQKTLQEAIDSMNDQGNGQEAVFLLRVWREIRQHLPQSYQNAALGLDSITVLQRLVAKAVCHAPLHRVQKHVAKANHNARVAGMALWEGNPPIPVLPSPWVFRLLRELSSAMAEIGTDIWSPQSVQMLKEHLRLPLASYMNSAAKPAPQPNGHVDTKEDDIQENHPNGEENLQEALEIHSTSQANGTLINGAAPGSSYDAPGKEIHVQRLFDLLYLINATKLEDQESGNEVLMALQASIQENADLSSESTKRIKEGAEEYWKRTSLLFALLA